MDKYAKNLNKSLVKRFDKKLSKLEKLQRRLERTPKGKLIEDNTIIEKIASDYCIFNGMVYNIHSQGAKIIQEAEKAFGATIDDTTSFIAGLPKAEIKGQVRISKRKKLGSRKYKGPIPNK